MLIDPTLEVPSLADAREIAESGGTLCRYPGLRNSLYGLWMPALEPTGSTLFNLNGYGNHGTLNANMDPGTAWVVIREQGLGWALDMSSGADLITFNEIPALDDFSLGVWYRSTHDGGASFLRLVHYYDEPNGFELMTLNDSSGKIQFRIEISYASDTVNSDNALNDDEWHWVVCRRIGATLTMFVDGVLQSGSGTRAGTIPASSVFVLGRAGGGTYPATRGGTMLWRRGILSSEIQQLYDDPMALVRPQVRQIAAAAVAGFTGPTLYRMGPNPQSGTVWNLEPA